MAESNKTGSDNDTAVDKKCVFLTPEERYEVYAVKSSERPYLLERYKESSSGNDGSDENDDIFPLPLTDGCDVPRWRAEGMTNIGSQLRAALNVGLGCSLLRRESQLPLPPSIDLNRMLQGDEYKRWEQQQVRSRWDVMKKKLMHQQPVTETLERISCARAADLLPETSGSDEDATESPRRKVFSKWETKNYPVIIDGCTKEWNLRAWDYDRLVARFGDVRWRFSDTHGAVMTLETYSKYSATEGLVDDSPLAVYDSEFGDSNSPMRVLATDYTTPPCFSDDLFALATSGKTSTATNDTIGKDGTATDTVNHHNSAIANGFSNSNEEHTVERSSDNDGNTSDVKASRPPWRWILMGPPRSGTGLHIDPLWTNAWVTLLEGSKRWILIPPHLQPQLPDGAGLREPQVPSIVWFRDYYDEVVRLDGIVEILQRPGETVFVPNGWPHLVLNLERTVAVTHNYASEFGPFERMWEQVLLEEPEFAQRWFSGLSVHRPDLASRIKNLSNRVC